MTAALERAWAEVQLRRASDPLAITTERERLASIIAEIWQEDPHCDLASTAVARFFSNGVADAT